MSDQFHEQKVRKMLEPKEIDFPCKDCQLFKREEERVNQFIANYKAITSLEDIKVSAPILLDTWEIKDKKAELWLVKGKLQIRAFGTIHNSVTLGEIIDRKVNEVKGDMNDTYNRRYCR